MIIFSENTSVTIRTLPPKEVEKSELTRVTKVRIRVMWTKHGIKNVLRRSRRITKMYLNRDKLSIRKDQ